MAGPFGEGGIFVGRWVLHKYEFLALYNRPPIPHMAYMALVCILVVENCVPRREAAQMCLVGYDTCGRGLFIIHSPNIACFIDLLHQAA
mmetsp:Transcript_53075/g.88317  ORF Transcript_53075/g.88317 Transcript_53075/m.88317 type:complete len:89 (+) Transcript_53075:372-638(+)